MAKPDFDSIKHLNPYNVEYWEARELMSLLGYGNKWQNFVDVIKKAMISCETTGNIVTDHFTAGSKMVERGPSYGGIYSWGARTTAPRQAEDPETATKGPGHLILAFHS